MNSRSSPPRSPIGLAAEGLPLALSVAFLAGFACLAVEFAIVRLCAPWFGQGTHVWANTVAVVLFTLALGYGMGGRIADRGVGAPTVVVLLVLAALWLAAAALFGKHLAAWLAPAAIGADRPHPLALFGSLAGTATLAGPPLLVIGAITPIVVAWRTARSTAGRASGFVGAFGTLGGLLGCAIVPMFLVPALGSRGVFVLAAACVALCALLVSLVRTTAGGPLVRGTSTDQRPVGRGAVAWALGSAFACGVTLTLVEFATVRRLAPRYGSDNGTWAVAIGTILAMSSLGSAFGVRRRALLAFAVAWITFAGLQSVPTGIGPRTTLALFGHALGSAIGVYFLSAVPPALVETLARRGRVGRSVSLVFGASTLGNVLGCYLAPLVLLPTFGTRLTFLAAAGLAAIGVVAAWCAGVLRRPLVDAASAPEIVESDAPRDPCPTPRFARVAPRLLALATLVGIFASSFAIGGPLRRDPGQLEEIETAYATVRVVERTEDGPIPGPSPLRADWKPYRGRFLGFDEDTTSYESVRLMEDENTALTGGRSFEHLVLGAWFHGQPWSRPDGGAPRILLVAYCGGTLHRILAATAPPGRQPVVTGIEIDADVVALARRRLGELPANVELMAGVDGRAGLASLPADRTYDLIIVDAYQRTQYIAFHLSTVEFFRECARRLTPNGYLGINSDSEQGASGKIVRCLAETVAEAFHGDAWLVPNPNYPGNVTIWGSASPLPPRVASTLDPRLERAGFCLDRFLVKYVRGTLGAFVLTDDRSPTEALTDDVLLADDEVK